MSVPTPIASVTEANFDEAYYLAKNPDVASWAAGSGHSGFFHFNQVGGKTEGRPWRVIAGPNMLGPNLAVAPVTTPTTTTPASPSGAGIFDSIKNAVSGIPTPVLIGGAALIGYFLFVGEDPPRRRR